MPRRGLVLALAAASLVMTGDSPCGSLVDQATGAIQDWSKVGAACAAQASKKSRPLYDELYSTVAGWRAGKPTLLLALNRYNDWNGFDQANLTQTQVARTVILHDAWNTMLCDSARSNGFDPSQLGNDEIARLLTGRGYAPG